MPESNNPETNGQSPLDRFGRLDEITAVLMEQTRQNAQQIAILTQHAFATDARMDRGHVDGKPGVPRCNYRIAPVGHVYHAHNAHPTAG